MTKKSVQIAGTVMAILIPLSFVLNLLAFFVIGFSSDKTHVGAHQDAFNNAFVAVISLPLSLLFGWIMSLVAAFRGRLDCLVTSLVVPAIHALVTAYFFSHS